MMSSSELQRISLSTARIITPEGAVDLEPLPDKDVEAVSATEQETVEAVSTESVNANAIKETNKPLTVNVDTVVVTNEKANLTNGLDTSPNRANETITSSIGDITVDSVRDHLNTTTTTLCSTTTEETVGKLN